MINQTLVTELLYLSNHLEWNLAKDEWLLDTIYFDDNKQTCLCGHYPILEICVIKNKDTKEKATVGNCCVKNFLDLPSDKIFSAIKRIKIDIEKSLNIETIEFAYSKKWINDWELNFYSDTFKKRSITDKQNLKRIDINQKILNKIIKK